MPTFMQKIFEMMKLLSELSFNVPFPILQPFFSVFHFYEAMNISWIYYEIILHEEPRILFTLILQIQVQKDSYCL